MAVDFVAGCSGDGEDGSLVFVSGLVRRFGCGGGCCRGKSSGESVVFG